MTELNRRTPMAGGIGAGIAARLPGQALPDYGYLLWLQRRSGY